MSFEEETHAGLKATKRGKRPASLSAEPSDSVDSAGDHLDETFPFETRLVGKYWVTAIVLQAVLYISCFVAATMPLGVEAGSWADSVPDGEEEAGEGTQQSPFESFIYFIVTWLLLYQIREIRPHVRAASEDELSYLKSESLQEKMKAIKRMKWHQTMCFVPQPLMAIDALVGSMGAGILVFRYAAMKTGCATGITDGLEQLDVVGVALLFVMALCVGLVIALLYIVARIHVAHFMAIQDTEAAREYLMDTEHTPRGSPKGMASRSLLRWYGFCIALQVVLLGMLSVAKDVVTEEGKEGSVGMAKTLYVLIGIGIFYLGQQAGHINDYMRWVDQLLHKHNPFGLILADCLADTCTVWQACANTRHDRHVQSGSAHRVAQPKHVCADSDSNYPELCDVSLVVCVAAVLHCGGQRMPAWPKCVC